MKIIKPNQRKFANIYDAAFSPYDPKGLNETGTHFIQLNADSERDAGFYIYRMAPGSRSTPHRHEGVEDFLIVDGEWIDDNRTIYRHGDVVWLAAGAEHSSYTETGCLVAV